MSVIVLSNNENMHHIDQTSHVDTNGEKKETEIKYICNVCNLIGRQFLNIQKIQKMTETKSNDANKYESTAILLTSPFCVDPMQLSDQNRIRSSLMSLNGCKFIEIDGTKEIEYRNELFQISKHIGKYPQLFICRRDKLDSTVIEHVFIGLWAQIETLIENDDINNKDTVKSEDISAEQDGSGDKEEDGKNRSNVNNQQSTVVGLKYTLKECFKDEFNINSL